MWEQNSASKEDDDDDDDGQRERGAKLNLNGDRAKSGNETNVTELHDVFCVATFALLAVYLFGRKLSVTFF